jgi:hypothetical protein
VAEELLPRNVAVIVKRRVPTRLRGGLAGCSCS